MATKTTTKKKMGRPALNEKQVEQIGNKIIPYLMTGHSLNMSILKAKVPRSTVYKLLEENRDFMDAIKNVEKYFTTLVNDVISGEIKTIWEKQDKNGLITKDDRQFIQWVVINNKGMHKYYGLTKDMEEKRDEGIERIKNDETSRRTILQTQEEFQKS